MGLFSSFRTSPPERWPDGVDSPDARRAHALLRHPGAGVSRTQAFAELAPVAQRLTPDEWAAVGLLRKAGDRHHAMSWGADASRGLSAGLLVFGVSPNRQHTALAWQPDGEGGARLLWVAGRAVDVPPSLADGTGHWCTDRLYLCPVVPADHPLQVWDNPFSRGEVRGVLVVDAGAGRNWLEWPAPDERWTEPAGREAGGRLVLYADRAAFEGGRVAREVVLQRLDGVDV